MYEVQLEMITSPFFGLIFGFWMDLDLNKTKNDTDHSLVISKPEKH